MEKTLSILLIVGGIVSLGFMSGLVMAQEIIIGATGNTPDITMKPGTGTDEIELRLNDGTGTFQIFDVKNGRSLMLIDPTTQNTAVGDATTAIQDFTIDCDTGVCNIQTRANNGDAKNTVRSLAGGDAIFNLRDDVATAGNMNVQIKTRDDGFLEVLIPPNVVLFEIDLKGNVGDVTFFGNVLDENGNCQFGPSC